MKSMLSNFLGIDIGTARIRICDQEQAILIDEPTLATIHKQGGGIAAVGSCAEDLLIEAPGKYLAVYPMKNGEVSDYFVLQRILENLLKRAKAKKMHVMMPNIVAAIPMGITEMQKGAIEDVIRGAGAKEVGFVNMPLAAAVGARMEVSMPSGQMIVTIGAGMTEAAVFCFNAVVAHGALPLGGNSFNQAIIGFIQKKYGALLGENTAEELKIKLKCGEKEEATVCGKSMKNGLPIIIKADLKDIKKAVSPMVEEIVEMLSGIINNLPEQVLSDVKQDGIILAGGSAKLCGLLESIEGKLSIPVVIAKAPEQAVIQGIMQSLLKKREKPGLSYGKIEEKVGLF